MKYTLMHKNLQVAKLQLDDATGFILKVEEIYLPLHLPVGVCVHKGIADRTALNEWWADRSIPASRSGVREALETLKLTDTKMLLTRCFGLSLSDQYWIKPEKSPVKWDDVNFFENTFSDDIGDVLFGDHKKENDFNFSSPDNTSDGCLKKRWKIIDGKRCLIKAGSNPFQQQPFNEAIASLICERLNIPHVNYYVMWGGDEPYSVCEDFVSSDTELISAWRVIKTQKKDNSTSLYRHYINCCKALGIDDVENSLDQMIILDYIIANEDRHLNNFGLLRNAETLKWIGAALIFDSGTSLGYDKLSGQITGNKNISCKPFKKNHEEQLRLVTSFKCVNFDNLDGVENDINKILSDGKASEYIDDARKNAIISSIIKRIDLLKNKAINMKNEFKDDINEDVKENIAEDYTQNSNEPDMII